MFFQPRPVCRPRSLIRIKENGVALRLEVSTGERMATHLRPMTLRDAFERRSFYRRPC